MRQVFLTCDRCKTSLENTSFKFKVIVMTGKGFYHSDENENEIDTDLCADCKDYIVKEIKFGDKK